MKSDSGPYEAFKHHYPLQEAIDMYMEIWNESDSSEYWVYFIPITLNSNYFITQLQTPTKNQPTFFKSTNSQRPKSTTFHSSFDFN